MHKLGKLLLLAAMALAAMSLAAPTAFAQLEEAHETLEVTREADGQHCPAVTKFTHTAGGGCLIHAKSEGEVELRKHVFGIESHITSCENEFYGLLNEDAEGVIYHQSFPGVHPACNRQPCKEAGQSEPTPWPAHGDEWPLEGSQPLEGKEVLETVFCIEPIGGGTDESCETEVPFNEEPPNQIPMSHEFEFGHAMEIPGHGVSGFRCELIGHWHTEGGGTLENVPGARAEEEVEVSHRVSAAAEMP